MVEQVIVYGLILSFLSLGNYVKIISISLFHILSENYNCSKLEKDLTNFMALSVISPLYANFFIF